MPRAYVAGPMRGKPKLNFPAFDKAASLGRSLGWQIISPADLDREHDIHEDAADVIDPEGVRVIVDRDVTALLSLRAESGDAIALLHGWEKSTGARAELAMAQWLGLRVVDARSFTDLNAKLLGYVETPLPAFCGMGGAESGCGSGGCGISQFDAEDAVKAIATRIANEKEI